MNVNALIRALLLFAAFGFVTLLALRFTGKAAAAAGAVSPI